MDAAYETNHQSPWQLCESPKLGASNPLHWKDWIAIHPAHLGKRNFASETLLESPSLLQSCRLFNTHRIKSLENIAT